MVNKMYTVYDSKAEAFLVPFFMRTKGEALRAWQQAVNDEQTQFSKYPSDFTLFEIGEYDDSTGTVVMHEAKISLGSALEFKKVVDVVSTPVAPVSMISSN